MRAFCVGFKDQAEIRISKTPPKENVSKVVREVKGQRKPAGWDEYWDGKWNGGAKKFTIKVVAFIGGKVVNVVTSRSFKARTGLTSPKHGEMVEFDYSLIEKFRKGRDGN